MCFDYFRQNAYFLDKMKVRPNSLVRRKQAARSYSPEQKEKEQMISWY